MTESAEKIGRVIQMMQPMLAEEIAECLTAHLPERLSVRDEVGRTGTNGEASIGLGLAITRRLIHEHHGRIWVESEVGKGTTFHVTLPLLPAVTEEKYAA